MKMKDVIKKKKKSDLKQTAVNVSFEDLKFIKTHNINMRLLVHEAVEDLRKEVPKRGRPKKELEYKPTENKLYLNRR